MFRRNDPLKRQSRLPVFAQRAGILGHLGDLPLPWPRIGLTSAISASPREASLLLLCMLTLCCASLRLPTLGYTFDLPLGYALSRGCSLPVDFATLRAACAAYRATALLLGSQPAPAGMCSGFRFQVSRFPFPPFRVLQCGWIRSKTVKSGEIA